MSVSKIQTTKDYGLFKRHSSENRPADIRKHKKLMESMKLYGFLRCFPIVVTRDTKGTLIVKDGQHRLMIAEALGLSVYWIEETIDFDVAIVNSTARVWQLRDYAEKHASNGLKSYTEGMAFAKAHSLPLGISFALLAGTTNFGNCEESFTDGSWKVKDRAWADAVAGVYGPLVTMASWMRNARLVEACMAVCRVPGFDASRLLNGAERCREKLVAYSTREGYLEMMEECYNHHRKQLIGLKNAAIMAMRERSAIGKKKAEKEQKKEKAA